MFKPMPNMKGCLTSDINNASNVMQVDENTYWQIANTLTVDDWTFAKIGEAPTCEYVRVTGIISPYVVSIDRGIDGTTANFFAANTSIEYILTYQAVQDALLSLPSNGITITGAGLVTVTEPTTGNFTVSVPAPVLESSDETVDITGTWPEFDINVVRGVNGCGCS